MITDDDGLRLTRERLAAAESAVEATRREVGDNPVQLHLFTNGLADIIREMRADIEAYLDANRRPRLASEAIALTTDAATDARSRG